MRSGLRSLRATKGIAMPENRPADLHDRIAHMPRYTLPWLCLAVGGGWFGYRAWQTHAARRRHRPHPVTVRPDGVGVDPLDAPARAAPRPAPPDRKSTRLT